MQSSYGGAAGLQRFVDACHARGLAVVLDVVYNHLGPEGNYLRDFGPYFTDQYRTPWGEALNFDGPGSDQVRAFFLANALMWQTDFHIDALRLDAVHAIKDASAYPFLAELADSSAGEGRRAWPAVLSDRRERPQRCSRLVRPAAGGRATASTRCGATITTTPFIRLLTGEREGYYEDFGRLEDLAEAYRSGFTYSGQYSPLSRPPPRQQPRGPGALAIRRLLTESRPDRQPCARGERLSSLCDWESLKLAAGLVLLSPYIPLLFMGEEYGETAPFLYFVSHGDPALVEAVRRGRREEFARFTWKGEVPDPQAEETFLQLEAEPLAGGRGPGTGLAPALPQPDRACDAPCPALGCRGASPPEVSVDQHRPDPRCPSRAKPDSSVRLLFHLGDAESRPQTAWPGGAGASSSTRRRRAGTAREQGSPTRSPPARPSRLVVPRRSFAVFMLAS